MNLPNTLSASTELVPLLSFAEEIYEKMGKGAEFASFCRDIVAKNAEKLKGDNLIQWHLELKEPSGEFTQIVFSDEFDESVLNPEWQWVNPRGDCCYNINSKSFWLEICATIGVILHPGTI